MAAAGPSSTPTAVLGENVKYAAVASIDDRVPVLQYTAATGELPESAFESKLDRLLQSGRISEKSRLTITDKDVGNIHYDSDSDFLFIVICNREYPQRAAFKFLGELKQRFTKDFADDRSAARSPAAQAMIRELCTEFNQVENVDKISGVNKEVEEVKTVMKQNLAQAFRNQENLNILLDESDAMKHEANNFSKTATSVKKKYWWQNTMLIIVIVALIVIMIIVIATTVTRNVRS